MLHKTESMIIDIKTWLKPSERKRENFHQQIKTFVNTFLRTLNISFSSLLSCWQKIQLIVQRFTILPCYITFPTPHGKKFYPAMVVNFIRSGNGCCSALPRWPLIDWDTHSPIAAGRTEGWQLTGKSFLRQGSCFLQGYALSCGKLVSEDWM